MPQRLFALLTLSLALSLGPFVAGVAEGGGDTVTQVRDLDARDGRVLWEAPHYASGYQSPEDLLVVNRTVLSPFSTWLKE